MIVRIVTDLERKGWIFSNISSIEWYFDASSIIKKNFVPFDCPNEKNEQIDRLIKNGVRVLIKV